MLRILGIFLLSAPAPASASTAAAAATATLSGTGIERRTVRIAEAATALLRLLTERRPGTTNEGDLLAVGRPRRTRVVIDARRHERELARCRFVDADERMIDAVADERDLFPVRRPLHVPVGAPGFDQRNIAAVCRGRACSTRGRRGNHVSIDLSLSRINDHRSVRRECRRRSFTKLPRQADPDRARRPDRPVRAARIARRIRDPSFAVRLRPAHERDDGAVVGDLDVADLDAVVGHEIRQPHRTELRRRSRVDVAHAALVRPPCDPIGFLRRDDVLRIRGTQELLDRRSGGCRSRVRRARQGKCGDESSE